MVLTCVRSVFDLRRAESVAGWEPVDKNVTSHTCSTCEAALGPDQFEWFRVDRAVGNVRNQGTGLSAPLDGDAA